MWQLAISVVMVPGRHAAGSAYYPIELINHSEDECVLADPDIAFLGAQGDAPIGPTFRAPAEPPTTLTLLPGRAAHAQLSISNADFYDPSVCKPVSPLTIRWLRVTLPGEPGPSPDPFRVLQAPFTPDGDMCSGSGNAGIGPIAAGRWLPPVPPGN